MAHKVIRGLKFYEYVQAFGVGEWLTRADLARAFEVHYTTAEYHLDRAVGERLLKRCLGWIGDKPGYLYALPETKENGV